MLCVFFMSLLRAAELSLATIPYCFSQVPITCIMSHILRVSPLNLTGPGRSKLDHNL